MPLRSHPGKDPGRARYSLPLVGLPLGRAGRQSSTADRQTGMLESERLTGSLLDPLTITPTLVCPNQPVAEGQ
jgi:hypothetical protein